MSPNLFAYNYLSLWDRLYNSGLNNIYQNLVTDLLALPANASYNNDAVALMNDWTFSIDGEVNNGWNFANNSDGSVSLTSVQLKVIE